MRVRVFAFGAGSWPTCRHVIRAHARRNATARVVQREELAYGLAFREALAQHGLNALLELWAEDEDGKARRLSVCADDGEHGAQRLEASLEVDHDPVVGVGDGLQELRHVEVFVVLVQGHVGLVDGDVLGFGASPELLAHHLRRGHPRRRRVRAQTRVPALPPWAVAVAPSLDAYEGAEATD